MARLETKSRTQACETLKRAAGRLFASRGVDGVTVREIAEAAGQKNHAAVGYHFGSKEALIRELILDGAILVDQRRNALLDKTEAQGGPTSIRQVVDILVKPAVDTDPYGEEETFNRFIVMLSMTHRDYLMEVLDDQWNRGYQRCLDHLRRLMPAMPDAIKNQRFVFIGASLGGVFAAREAELADETREHPTWRSPETLDHLASVLTAMLEAPPP